MALSPEVISELRHQLGAENVLTTVEDLIPYSFDGTAALLQAPGCVAFVTTTEQIVGVLKLANRTRTPLVTRGSGTGLRDRKSTRLNSSHVSESRMPSSA